MSKQLRQLDKTEGETEMNDKDMAKIVSNILDIATVEIRGNDSLDFPDIIPVCDMKRALKEAYKLGYQRGETK